VTTAAATALFGLWWQFFILSEADRPSGAPIRRKGAPNHDTFCNMRIRSAFGRILAVLGRRADGFRRDESAWSWLRYHLSLGGIAIAIGAMVDAAIVMIENAHKHLERAQPGTARIQILIAAASEVGPALFLQSAHHHRVVFADFLARGAQMASLAFGRSALPKRS
jgi:hypothetical protein